MGGIVGVGRLSPACSRVRLSVSSRGGWADHRRASARASDQPTPRLVIRTLVNNSFEPNLETRHTDYLRHEFSSGSGTQVVPDSEAADLVLTGQILSRC